MRGGGGARIDCNILKDDVVDHICFSVAAEAYIIHAANNALPAAEKPVLLREIGRIKSLIRQAGPPQTPSEEILADNGTGWADRRDRILRSIAEAEDNIDLVRLSGLDLDPNPDIFFETLLGMIKNELFIYQIFARKQLNLTTNNLKAEIKRLKESPVPDWDSIFALENRLDNIADTELQYELKKYAQFDILNDEKITPFFIKMAKAQSRKVTLR
jgi:hypothetical protein